MGRWGCLSVIGDLEENELHELLPRSVRLKKDFSYSKSAIQTLERQGGGVKNCRSGLKIFPGVLGNTEFTTIGLISTEIRALCRIPGHAMATPLTYFFLSYIFIG